LAAFAGRGMRPCRVGAGVASAGGVAGVLVVSVM
jgi:hypothetical protein